MDHDFTSVARLPSAGDNVAIATQTLEDGTRIRYEGQQFQLSHTILEGHRFAIQSISENAPLLSWGLPFGFATRSIAPGDYVCNQKMIDSLSIRNLPFALPETPNFSDKMAPYVLDESEFRSGKQVERYTNERHYLGYQRPGETVALARETISSLWGQPHALPVSREDLLRCVQGVLKPIRT